MRIKPSPGRATVPTMSDQRAIQLDVTLDGRLVSSETTCVWIGPYVLAVATVLPDRGLAFELHSVFVGQPGVPTCVTHLVLGPVGFSPFTISAEHEHTELNPKTMARECVYEHAAVMLETLTGLDYEVRIAVSDHAFGELERVEV
jgi:hypothetical protein